MASNNPLIAEGEIGLGRDVSEAVPGGFSAAGAINGNLRARAAGVLLEGVMGTRVKSGGFDAYTPANNLPWWTIEKKVGTASPQLLVLRYQDAFINTLNVSAPSGGLSTFSAGIITAGETRQATATVTPSYASTTDDLLVFHGGRVMNGATGAVVARDETFQSVEIVINNNTAADEYTVRPSRFLRSLTEGIRSVELNITLVFENPDKYSQYVYNNTGNASTLPHTPGYSFFMGAFQLILGNFQLTNDGQDLVGSTLTTPAFNAATPSVATGVQAVQFNIYKVAFTGFPVALQSGRIAVTTSARALAPSSGNIIDAWVRPTGGSASTTYDSAG